MTIGNDGRDLCSCRYRFGQRKTHTKRRIRNKQNARNQGLRIDGDSTQTSALHVQVKQMRAALEQIVRWDGFPRVPDRDDPSKDYSYGVAYGSNGERDFMRDVARRALFAPPATERKEPADMEADLTTRPGSHRGAA